MLKSSTNEQTKTINYSLKQITPKVASSTAVLSSVEVLTKISRGTDPIVEQTKKPTIVNTPTVKQTNKPKQTTTIVKRTTTQNKPIYDVGGVVYKVTAYDLSYASCGKSRNDPNYGLTCCGYSLKGKTWETARVVAADLRIFPINTRLNLVFKGSFTKYNGVYTVKDTGGAIKGKILDFYLGENMAAECDYFGVQYATVNKVSN